MNSEDIVLEIGGVAYYIDFDNIEKILTSTDADLEAKEMEETETETSYFNGGVEKTVIKVKQYHKGREVDLSRYETYRMMIEILLTYNEELDDALGLEVAIQGAPLSFKIAFNTLVRYGILKQL
jgi:predicted metal-dependent hydrolase